MHSTGFKTQGTHAKRSLQDTYDDSDALPLISRTNTKNYDHNPHRTPSLISGRVIVGFDFALVFLLLNGLVAIAWGIALIVFAAGVVPISWTLSQYGSQHSGITNVIVTGVCNLGTAQLTFMIQNAVREYAAMYLYQGFTLKKWKWMQNFAEGSIWPPFEWRMHKISWVLWLLLYGGMAEHNASLVAILQPDSFYKNFLFNDTGPCGVDPSSLSLKPSIQVQSQLDQAAFSMGVQLGNYYEQVAGNSTTSVLGRVFVKDSYGYGALGGLSDGLQEVPGVQFAAQCGDSTTTPSLESLWSSSFPSVPFPTVNITDGVGTFNPAPINDSSQAFIMSAPRFSLVGNDIALYAVVNASGNGGLVTVGVAGNMTGCTWAAIPRLVHVEMVGFTAMTLESENATDVPAPIGRAVSYTVQGMSQAVNLGAQLEAHVDETVRNALPGVRPSTPRMLELLLGDGAKAALTGYASYCINTNWNEALIGGATQCHSNNRTVQQHWRFGNTHGLGTLAIVLTIGFGLLAVWVVWAVRDRPRMKGFDPLTVVDAFKLGLDTSGAKIDGVAQVLKVRNGRVILNEGGDVNAPGDGL